jgi:hypothetical protein
MYSAAAVKKKIGARPVAAGDRLPRDAADEPRLTARLVLLGASNVRRGLPVVVQTARAAFGPHLEVFGAIGHGRSYGKRSCIPFRCLPGILDCGIWEALSAGAPAAETAIVTDVGNDIQYGADAASILGWVRECAARLTARGAAIRITGLPLARLERIRPSEYLFFRTLFFRGSRVGRDHALREAAAIDAGLRDLAARTGATMVETSVDWYGADPIHILRPKRADAWARILGVSAISGPMGLRDAVRLRTAAPALRWIAGVEQRRKQPSLAFRDGTRVSLY